MGTTTPNYGLFKPVPTDPIDLETDFNENWDRIDAHDHPHDHDSDYEPVGTLGAHAIDTTNVHGIADTAALATQSYVTTAISNLVDAAPGALDTLNELAAALGDDANFSTTVTNALAAKADSATVTASLATKADALVTANRQTGNYTLVLGDAGKVIEMNVAGANTLTVPPNSSVAFPVGTVLEGMQYGAGQTTITPGSGVTIRSSGGKLKTTAQYSSFSLRKIATDEWHAVGELSA